MQQNNMWTSFLRLGSLISFLLLLFGCDTSKTEYVHKADWIYTNNSIHTIEVKGFRGFTSLENGDFILLSGESHCLEYRGDGQKNPPPEAFGDPFQYTSKCSIIIDNTTTIAIEKGTYFREQKNYKIEKLKNNYYRFTYTFNDELIQQLLATEK